MESQIHLGDIVKCGEIVWWLAPSKSFNNNNFIIQQCIILEFLGKPHQWDHNRFWRSNLNLLQNCIMGILFTCPNIFPFQFQWAYLASVWLAASHVAWVLAWNWSTVSGSSSGRSHRGIDDISSSTASIRQSHMSLTDLIRLNSDSSDALILARSENTTRIYFYKV